jgi:hypothetical protein
MLTPQIATRKQIRMIKMSNVKAQMSKLLWILEFEIDLTFACLREAASAKAGILKFGI